jgi:hypothetical protein
MNQTTVSPGSWWRLGSDQHDLHNRSWRDGYGLPAHGLVLLVSEVRVIDGEIHTIVLNPHPLWKSTRNEMLLADDFFASFTPCDRGEELRDIEMGQLMGRISDIGTTMNNIPEDHLLREMYPDEVEPDTDVPSLPRTAGGAQVPAALLPGRDILQAQTKLHSEIELMRLRQTWIQEQQAEMKLGWDIMTAYQNEKASAVMAGIAAKTEQAKSLLGNIHSMGLWLGDGVSVEKIVSGASADPEEPLHLMQRMLFLDEEIVVEDVLGEGFSSENMDRLPGILKSNPGLVDRMLPHPRCVVISRVRRQQREFRMPADIAGMFRELARHEADMRINILVRDGENISIIRADEETSHAERLFPSRAEINEIFTKRRHMGSSGAEPQLITPQDIEYSDKRSEHDKRALFYRRFLLILWGAHEREQVFGPFLPAGANWLEETAAGDRFRFVHDEEDVLPDGRLPVLKWIRNMNRSMSQGSHVIVHSGNAINEDTMPDAFKYSHQSNCYIQNSFTVEDFVDVRLAKSGNKLVAGLSCLKSSRRGRQMTIKRQLVVRNEKDELISEGVLCLDRVSSSDLEYYISSRIHRQSYLEWIGMFMKALPLVREREQKEEALVSDLIEQSDINADDRELARIAVRTMMRVGDKAPGSGMRRRLAAFVSALRNAPDVDLENLQSLQLGVDGKWYAQCQDEEIENLAFPMPLLREYMISDAGPVKLDLVQNSYATPRGRLVHKDLRETEHMQSLWKNAPVGLSHLKDWNALQDPEMDLEVGEFMKPWSNAKLVDVFVESMKDTRASRTDVVTRYPQIVLGAIVAPDADLWSMSRFRAYALVATLDPYLEAMRTGHETVVQDFVCNAYLHPERCMTRIYERIEKDEPSRRLSIVPLKKGKSFHQLASRGYVHELPYGVQAGTARINADHNADAQDRVIKLDTLEKICLWSGRRSVTSALGEKILCAAKNVRRFTGEHADHFIAKNGF